jgi:uncharacterized protein DUF4893
LVRYARNDVKAAALLLGLAVASAGCNVILQPPGMIAEWTTAWRRIVTPDDSMRLRDWRTTFTTALTAARKSGHSADIDREGALLDPDAALANGAIPNGMYRCRVIKLGAKAEGNLAYVSYPGFTCRVRPDHQLQRLAKLGGSQRYVGILFPSDGVREVFLGTLVLGDERRALQYGQDQARDVAGFVERIGPSRWRLVMPKPHFESQLDVMELVPLPEEPR